MRVTGGELCGRRIKTGFRGIRPTQDKVREALFSCIGNRVCGCRFLDLFAGTGAVGLEAWSRGAGFVCWVESSARVMPVLRENVEVLCGMVQAGEAARTRIVRKEAIKFLRHGAIDLPFDMIFADPPYAPDHGCDWRRNILRTLAQSDMLAKNGLFVIEEGVGGPVVECEGWVLTREKAYGGSALRFFRRRM